MVAAIFARVHTARQDLVACGSTCWGRFITCQVGDFSLWHMFIADNQSYSLACLMRSPVLASKLALRILKRLVQHDDQTAWAFISEVLSSDSNGECCSSPMFA